MHVDVFMRELSYEVIEQQEAYSMTSLWSEYRFLKRIQNSE